MAKKRTPPPASPGALLRAKREANGWSQAEVAWALCLAERQMRALEADDYDKLPGRAYILGYWHNYANLLGISIDHAIEAHKSRLPTRGARIAVRAESRRAHGSLETARRRWALAFGALATVFIASLWLWQGRDNGFALLPPDLEWRWPAAPQAAPPAWNGTAVDTVDAIADASVLPEPNFSAAESADESPAVESADESPTDSTRLAHSESPRPRNEPPNHARNELSRPARNELSRPARNELSRHARNLLSGRATTESLAPPESPAPTQTATTANPAAAETVTETVTTETAEQIVLAVSEASWIEVHDGDGQRLLYRSVDRGARLTLRGALPFSVFIGNPAGVSVEYRGRRVPFTAARDGLFARFNIGVP